MVFSGLRSRFPGEPISTLNRVVEPDRERRCGFSLANFRIREFTEKFILIPRLDMQFERDRRQEAIAFSAEFTGGIVKTL